MQNISKAKSFQEESAYTLGAYTVKTQQQRYKDNVHKDIRTMYTNI